MNTSRIVTLSTKGQLVLPQSIRTAAGLTPGSPLRVTLEADGAITIRQVLGSLDLFFHALDGLPAPGPLDLDEAVLESVESLDHASRDR